MINIEQFFYDHAGYSYNPRTQTENEGRIETARKLAEAEAYVDSMGWEYEWLNDEDADPFDWDGDGPMGTEALGCVLKDGKGNVLESLWGIWDADANYSRVVKAELALDAMLKPHIEIPS